MRRGHVEGKRAYSPEREPVAQSPRLAPGVCPKCLQHIGRAMRAHSIVCGVEQSAPVIAAHEAPKADLVAPKPLIGPQPKPQETSDISPSPRLPRLVHGNDRNGRPMPGRRRNEGSLAQRQAEAVAAMKRQTGLV